MRPAHTHTHTHSARTRTRPVIGVGYGSSRLVGDGSLLEGQAFDLTPPLERPPGGD